MRMARPFLRKLVNGVERWYYPQKLMGGKMVPMKRADGTFLDGQAAEQEALDLWHEFAAMQRAPVAGDGNLFDTICELYLKRLRDRGASPHTIQDYTYIYQAFYDRWPELTVADLRATHVQTLFREHPQWGPSYCHHIGKVLKSALNWAAGADSGHLISKNPLVGMSLPSERSRGASSLITDADHEKFLARVPEDLQQILILLRHTGARPSSLCRAEARNLDVRQRALIFGDWNTDPASPAHKTAKKTGRALVIPLTPVAFELCQRLAQKYPEGALLRTKRGKPWTPRKIAHRVDWYKKQLGMPDFICYGYRHTVATELLEQGVQDAEVAAILGHASVAMIHRHYSHLGARITRLRETLTRHRAALPSEIRNGEEGKQEVGGPGDEASAAWAEVGAPGPAGPSDPPQTPREPS